MAGSNVAGDPLLNILQMERETFWTEHAHFPVAEQHRLWSNRIMQLTSALGSAPSTAQLGFGAAPQFVNPTSTQGTPAMARRSSDVPMSQSHSHRLDRNKSSSQRSATMLRKRSNDSCNGPTPFTATGNVPPLTIKSWQTNGDEPWNGLNAGQAPKLRRTESGRRVPSLHIVPEVAVYDPIDFVRDSEDLNATRASFSPSTLRNQRSRRNSHRLSLSSGQLPSFSSPLSQSPATPTTDQLTNATTLTSGMSRQSSIASSFCGGLDMLQISSQTSDSSSTFSTGGEQSPPKVHESLPVPNDSNLTLNESDRSYFLAYNRSVVNDLQFPQPVPSSFANPIVSAPPVSFPSLEEDVGMKRSSSTESNASSRATRRRQEQVVQASRKIAPKLSDDEASMSRQASASGHQMIRIRSADGSSKEVVPIEKAPYVRPTHDKVKCDRCDEHPDGFRGAHELQRHTERAHSLVRKAWICVDISTDKKFLASCKACRNKKRYNAYYNAVAHLRRIHFNPKQKGRKGKGKPDEHRGGKGGGDFPSIDIVKEWMREIDEVVPENMPPYNDDELDINSVAMNQLVNEFEAPKMLSSYSEAPNHSNDGNYGILSNTIHPNTTSLLASSAPIQMQPYDHNIYQLPEQVPVISTSDVLDLSCDVSMNDTFAPFDMSPLDNLPPFGESNDSNFDYFPTL